MGIIMRRFRAQSRPVQVLLLNELSLNLSFYMLYPYLAVYFTRDLGFATWMVGLTLGFRTLCQQGLMIIGGTLADRIGYKTVIIIGLALRAVGFALFGLVNSLPGVLCAAMLTGLAGAFFSPALRAYLATEAVGRRAEIFALANVFGQVGTFTGPLVGLALLGVNFTAVSLTAGGLFALLTLVQIRYLPPNVQTHTGAVRSVWQDWREVLGNRPFLLFSLSTFGYFMVYNQLYLALPIELERRTGSSAGGTAIFVLSAIITVAGQVRITATLRNRVTPATAVVIGLATMSCAFVPPLLAGMLPFAWSEGSVGAGVMGFLPALLSGGLLTLGFIIAQPFAQEMVALLSRERLVSTYYGFFAVAHGLGATVGNAAVGAAFDIGSTRTANPLPWVFLIVCGLGSATAIYALEQRHILPTAPAPTGAAADG